MQILTVSQATGYLRLVLESDPVLEDLWVSGEVGSLSRSAAGHAYFTLKDAESQLRCVLFRGQARRVQLESGLSAIVHGRISLYPASGALQLYVDLLQPAGVGALHLQFELLRSRLEAEGLFDPSRKRPLPRFPQRIGVVTSPSGAVIHDICTVLARRYPLVEVLIAPATVQGDGATPTIVAAIERLNARADVEVIIVARGGGSIEELWPFNEEAVARAVFGSRIPVISAIGHETDLTMCDLVADVRAPTPSAAAELVVPDAAELRQRLDLVARALTSSVEARLEAERGEVSRLVGLLSRAAPRPEVARARVAGLTAVLGARTAQRIALRREALRGRSLQLQALSPRLTLARGFALVQRADSGTGIRSIADVQDGDLLDVRLIDGTIQAGVKGNGRPCAGVPDRDSERVSV